MRTAFHATLLAALAAHSPARTQPEPKPDAELIQGKWQIVGLEAGGNPEPDRNYKGNSLTFTRDKATLREWGFQPIEFAYTIDPDKSPRTIDLTARNATVRGIYRLDGDDLTLCLSLGGLRPTDFTTKGTADTELFTLRRDRWEAYADSAFGYTIELPSKPEERRRTAKLPTGDLATTLHVVRRDSEKVAYLVSATQLPGKPDAKETAAVFDAVRDVLVAEVGGEAKATLDGERQLPAGKGGPVVRELTVALDGPEPRTRLTVRVHFIVTGERVYALAVAGTEEGLRAADAGRFWRSFTPTPPKKK